MNIKALMEEHPDEKFELGRHLYDNATHEFARKSLSSVSLGSAVVSR